MKILELRTGLFPDAKAVAAALCRLVPEHGISRIDVSLSGLEEEAWDRALAAILASDLIVVT
jgi:hypothetical protein